VGAVVAVLVLAGQLLIGSGNAAADDVPRAYLVFNVQTGAILATRNPHAQLYPASTIKLLTALTVLSRLPLNSTVTVSPRAASQPAMRMGFPVGATWPLDEMLHSLLIVSANDAAFAVAERAGGSIEQFAIDAQAEARQLGLVDTTFRDPSGLDGPGAYGGGTLTSAYDMAIVARNALAVPELATIVNTRHYDFTDPTGQVHHLDNHNITVLNTYPGATGMKTGFTNRAERTLIASATRDGRSCAAVVLGTFDDKNWAYQLLNQCFAAPQTATGVGALPPVRIVTADERAAQERQHPAKHRNHSAKHPKSSAKPTKTAAKTAAPATQTVASASTSHSSNPLVTILEVVAVVLATLFVAVVLLRLRALRRQKRRRAAREAMRARVLQESQLPEPQVQELASQEAGPG
jgi:D-alanyl-D-alanine carboxypeptidase (penicillin-binding protein 5/6)